MKKYTIYIIILLSNFSCKKIDKQTHFNLDLETQVTFPSTNSINVIQNINYSQISTNSINIFENNNTSKDLIEGAKLQKMKLSVINPSNGNFNFIKDIEVFMSADGLPEIKIAWKLNHQNDGKIFLNLDTSNNDFKEYIKNNQMNLRISFNPDEILRQDYDVKIEYSFIIDAEILGA